MSREKVLIIGGGQAAAQTAVSLRQLGFAGDVTLIGDEPALPYQRPPLSKTYLAGESAAERLQLKPPTWYDQNSVLMLTETKAARVDLGAQVVETANKTLRYDHLVFATGSRNRTIKIPGIDLENVFSLRTMADADRLRQILIPGRQLVIVGGGYIGLEIAAVACSRGVKVTIVELADRLLARVAGPVISAFYEELHRSAGVTVLTGTSPAEISGHHGRALGVALSNGRKLECDAVLIGVGILPNSELAQSSGIACDDGILVDACARTDVEGVFATGDCTRRLVEPFGRRIRLESVHNAIEQGKQVAAAITAAAKPDPDCPWFWSDQYDVKLQIAGLSTGFDQTVIRGSISARKFAVFYFSARKLIAVEAVNCPAEFVFSKKLIMTQGPVEPARFGEANLPIKDIASTYLDKERAN